MGKIATELRQAVERRAVRGGSGAPTGRTLARGEGWAVDDVICTAGPGDRSFEEQHRYYSIAVVVAGTFQYRTGTGSALLTPGALLLGNAGACFECGHDHGAGDRCVAFRFEPETFHRVIGSEGSVARFGAPRVAPERSVAPMVARACAGIDSPELPSWEELAVELAGTALRSSRGQEGDVVTPPKAAAAVSRSVRAIERHPAAGWSLRSLAAEARISPYHYLRIFQAVTGLTPHQFVMRTRLREAAIRLATEPAKVIDVALGAGFGDLSNFNHAFKTEFGTTPTRYRSRPADRR